jgi:HlyD family secretion protein
MTTTTTPDRIQPSSNGQAPPPPMTKRRRSMVPVVATIGVFAAVALGGGYLYQNYASATGGSQVLTTEAERGSLVVSVTEEGTVKAAEQVVIKSEIEGRAGILYLRPEGEEVQEGDLLVELDVSSLQDQKVDREIAVQNGEAAFIRAQEQLAVAENQAKADVAAAELDFRFAQEDLRKYIEGDFPRDLKEAENRITIAEEELERARVKREGSDRLLAENFISQAEFDGDVLSEKKAQLDLELARQSLELLRKWEYERRMAQLESDVEQRELALERAQRKASADVVQAQADLRAREAELSRHRSRLAKTVDQIGKGRMYAPTSGQVVHATTGGGGWRGNQEPLEEGQEVRERQELIYLPTATDRIVDIRVHESSIDKVRTGLPVRVTSDLLPGQVFWGRVSKVAPMPDADTSWLNPDLKVYTTEVLIEDAPRTLRAGVSARAEIIVESFDDVVYVPVQSVVQIGGKPTVFVETADGSAEGREVEIGLDNNSEVVITGGLAAGEKVLLNPPLRDTGSVGGIQADDVPEEKRQQAEAAKENPTAREQQAESDTPQLTRQQMMQLGRQVMAKASEDEQQTMGDYFRNGDMAGGMQYSLELAKKYNIRIPGQRAEPTTQPATRPADAEAADAEPQEEQAAQDPQALLMSKLTDAERERLNKLREDESWREWGTYRRELAEKYDVELPAWGGRRGGGGGQ